MTSRNRIKDQYPVFQAFGDQFEFLDVESAVNATPEDRIKSIWPFIVRRVLHFHATLKARECANFDPEDTITELWVKLRMKDSDWIPERGKYITFAGTIIDRELCSIRDRSRTVESPRNSSCRQKEYNQGILEGTITQKRLKTANDIVRTNEGIKPIIPSSGRRIDISQSDSSDPANIVAEQESVENSASMLRQALRCLEPAEAMVVGKLNGLWGKKTQTVHEIAWESGREESEVRSLHVHAIAKLQGFLGGRMDSLSV